MTTIAYKAGIVAADTRETYTTEAGGSTIHRCEKLFRKRVGRRDVIIATAGGTYAGMLFVDWYGTGKPTPDILADLDLEEDFDVLIFDRGKIYGCNHLCRPVEVIDPFTAIGSGRKAALGAMHAGKNAYEAVRIACLLDPYSALPIKTMLVPGRSNHRAAGKPSRAVP